MAYFKNPVDERLARYDHLIIHCTATGPDQNNIDAEWVDTAHKNKGWNGCGYHAVITRDGDVQTRDGGFMARSITRQGSHVGACGPGWNARSLGVSLAGGVDNNGRPDCNFTEQQYDALTNFIDNFLDSHPKPEDVKIMGHRDLIKITRSSPKACPCFDVQDFISERKLDIGDEDLDPIDVDSPMSLPESYEVKSGDNLWKISRLFGVSVDSIRSKNGLQSDTIQPGQILKI